MGTNTRYALSSSDRKLRCGQEGVSSPHLSKSAVVPTQPLVQWVLGGQALVLTAIPCLAPKFITAIKPQTRVVVS